MPFVQMENISHFLRACQSPPLNLQSHDIFQTVDLYESKDPAQVLQCISAFSRRAHAVQPARFHGALGEKSKGSLVSPQSTGGYTTTSPQYGRPRGSSNLSETNSNASSQPSQAIGGRGSPFVPSSQGQMAPKIDNPSKSPSGGVSSWSKRGDEGATTPAWNIHQYGYMGGASQGNQGISFGGRRQITTPAPKVPSFADKERKRREQEAEAERVRVQEEETERRRRIEREEEEERERIAEERRWEEETRRQKEQEQQRFEEEERRREVEQKRRLEQEARANEHRETEARLASERNQRQAASEVRLTGQFLSQYQSEKKQQPSTKESEKAAERSRIQELERQLEEGKAREAQYERERQERIQAEKERKRSRSRPGGQRDRRNQSRSKSRTRSVPVPSPPEESDPWQENEREYLSKQWTSNNQPPPSEPAPPPQPPRPLPTPQISQPPPQPEPTPTPSPPSTISIPARPLPDPMTYTQPPPTSPQRRSPFARPTSTPSSPPQPPTTQRPSQPPTNPLKKPPFAKPSSLLSREMELDRQRQQEWEEAQKATKSAAEKGGMGGDGPAVTPGGGAWDVHQYGYLGGDSQNRGGTGIGFGMGRRQLVGPREPPGKGTGTS